MAFVRLIAIAKDEGAYLAEWIHHHLLYGFDEIAIILNSCTDNSREQLECIAKRETRVLIRDGDPLKNECQSTGKNFQIAAYSQELAVARQDGHVTHVMCLDIDEFWVTPGLQDSIHDFVERYPEADSVAFAWHIEVPTHPAPFSPALVQRYSVQKNRHVKSLNRLSPKLHAIGIHNAEHIDGIYLLSDGTKFPEIITDGASRALLPEALFKQASSGPDTAFIYHRVFRSEREYLASLQRGRPNQLVQLKDNRWGYRCETMDTPILQITHPMSIISALQKSLDSFVQNHYLAGFIQAAQTGALTRALATIQAYTHPTPEVCQLTFLFAGLTSLPEPPEQFAAHIAHHIDSVVPVEGGISIVGWAIDKHSRRSVEVWITDVLESRVTRLARPDVEKHYPGTHAESGFRIEIQRQCEEALELNLRCGHTRRTHKVPIPVAK